MNKAVISVSGGLDSTCLLLQLLSEGKEVKAYAFNYGQKHTVELEKLQTNIKFLQEKNLPVTLQIINLKDVFADSASSLCGSGGEIPKGDYAEDNMKSTVVENRNVIFSAVIFSKALAWSKSTDSDVEITMGVHAGDHCFTEDTNILTPVGMKTIHELKIGDPVYSLNTKTGEMIEDKCLDIIEKGTNDRIYEIATTTGDIRLTSEHKIFVYNRVKITDEPWECDPEVDTIISKKVKDLKVGDYMVTFNDIVNKNHMPALVTDIHIKSGEEKVYDISVEKNHNFFAGNAASLLISNSLYPDTTPESVEMSRELYRISNWGSERVSYVAPFVNIPKSGVLKAGIDAMYELGFSPEETTIVLKNTHSCYDPDEQGRPCGRCGTCRERIEAFAANGMKDPVEYQE